MSNLLDRCERNRLRLWLGAFLLALALPSAVLLLKALDQLKWESLRQSQLIATELTARIDGDLAALIRAQDARGFGDFAFLAVAGDPAAGFVQRSPLAEFPPDTGFPGLIGWFQIDADGRFDTPLLPGAGLDAQAYGVGAEELAQRQATSARMAEILERNALVPRPMPVDAAAPTPRPRDEREMESEAPAAPDRPTRGRVADSPFEDAQPSGIASQAAFDRLAASGSDGGAKAARRAQEPRTQRAPAVEQLALREKRSATTAAVPEAAPIDRGFSADSALVGDQDAAEAAPEPLDAAPMVESPGALASSDPAAMPPTAEALSVEEPAAPSLAAAPPPPAAAPPVSAAAVPARIIRTFESELDPFRISLLDSGHFVLFRWAWRDGARYVQGGLIEQQAFLAAFVERAYRASALSRTANLRVDWNGRTLADFAAAGASRDYLRNVGTGDVPAGTLIHRERLPEPFGPLQLTISADRLPRPAGAVLIYWLGAVLTLVLTVGTWLLYRLGMRQLRLVRQQQDFVAAVSHELKTPLTSIRMYSEMLREGWVNEDRRQRYYRFIHDESERLSRLVANVLQLARMSRDELRVDPRPVPVNEALEQTGEPLATLAAGAGFELVLNCECSRPIRVDIDALTQILLNLVDNAVKFAADADARRVDIGCTELSDGRIEIRVRDYGPGIPRAERERVFGLFQRLESEATRTTRGTGIGLALVRRLTEAMGGEVALYAAEPGAELRLRFPAAATGGAGEEG